MALTDAQIRSLKPAGKSYKITDERGLYLEIQPGGSKLWRYKYGYMGKEKRIALGRYPDVGLAEARRRRAEARDKLDKGVDPLLERKREKLVASFTATNTFGSMAKEYLEKMVGDRRAETTINKANWLLEKLQPIAVRCPRSHRTRRERGAGGRGRPARIAPSTRVIARSISRGRRLLLLWA